ncbi:MAG: amidohydrolase family protein [Actinomycetota bacterium]
MFDVVIRNGTIVDGSGADPYVADVAIDGDRIAAIGCDLPAAHREIDATGRIVTPGFVDIHTHYDGQATWDAELAPSTPHGVTTVVFGNCGVGFAPVRPGQEQFLIELMEGVEDIPGSALSEGMTWGWESFGEYLDALEAGEYAADVAAMIAHGPVRAYVMGERGTDNEPATQDEIDEMARIVAEAIQAGARGFSTSRTLGHRALSGEPVPGTFAAEDELFAIGRAVKQAGRGLFEVAPSGVIPTEDHISPDLEVDWMCRLAEEAGVPVTFLMLQTDVAPDDYRKHLELIGQVRAEGHPVTAQVAGRPFGVLLGLTARHPFMVCPSYAPLVELPLDELVAAMSEPSMRTTLIDEYRSMIAALREEQPLLAKAMENFDRTYPLGDPVNYEPTDAESIAGVAAATDRDPVEVYYDALLERDGRAIVLNTLLGYTDGDGEALYEMLSNDHAVIGLADGGAHCNLICDASTPTWMLTHWCRDRNGAQLRLADVIRKMTSETAALFGFDDRGRIEVGLRADLNVIDHDRLTLREPHMVADLPAGGTRFLQDAEGYDYTLVAGQITRDHDAFTGATPGRLVRLS